MHLKIVRVEKQQINIKITGQDMQLNRINKNPQIYVYIENILNQFKRKTMKLNQTTKKTIMQCINEQFQLKVQ